MVFASKIRWSHFLVARFYMKLCALQTLKCLLSGACGVKANGARGSGVQPREATDLKSSFYFHFSAI